MYRMMKLGEVYCVLFFFHLWTSEVFWNKLLQSRRWAEAAYLKLVVRCWISSLPPCGFISFLWPAASPPALSFIQPSPVLSQHSQSLDSSFPDVITLLSSDSFWKLSALSESSLLNLLHLPWELFPEDLFALWELFQVPPSSSSASFSLWDSSQCLLICLFQWGDF